MSTVVSSTMEKAADVEFIIQRGDDLSHVIGVVDSTGAVFPVTGYTAVLKVFNNSAMEGSPILSLTTPTDITVNGAAGQFTIVQSDTVTTNLGWSNGWYYFQMTSPSAITKRIMQGEISVL